MFILKKVEVEKENRVLIVSIGTNGQDVQLPVQLPEFWDNSSRQEKMDFVKQEVSAHLASYNYRPAQELVFPDPDAPAQARENIANLPGWATWTGQDAADALKNAILAGMSKADARAAIDAQFAGVNNLATAVAATIAVLKQLSDAMIDSRDVGHQNEARAIMYLRDIVVEK